MFGFKLIRKETYKRLVDDCRRQTLLITCAQWFHESHTVRDLLYKFGRGEVTYLNIDKVRKDFFLNLKDEFNAKP